MKTRKKQKISLLFLLGILALCFSVSSVQATTWTGNVISGMVSTTYYNPAACSPTDLYLEDDHDTDGKSDFGVYLNENFRIDYDGATPHAYDAAYLFRSSDYGAFVTCYTPLPTMIYKIYSGAISTIDNDTFYRASAAFPYETAVRMYATHPNLIVFEAPADDDISKNTVVIKYDFGYSKATEFIQGQVGSYRYNALPGNDINYYGNAGLSYITTLPGNYGNTKRSRGVLHNGSTCRKINLHRCGDGYTDIPFAGVSFFNSGFLAEVCDDGLLNGQAGHCDINCGRGGGYCGDSTINDGASEVGHGPIYSSGGVEMIEECDAGILNGSDLCTSDCAFPVIDQAVDEAVNE